MSTHPFWIKALLVAAGSLLVAQEQVESSPVEGATKKVPAASIGVVDLAKALERYPKAIKMEQQLKQLQDSFNEKLGEIERKIAEARENLKAVGEGTEEFKERKFEFDSYVQVYEFQRKRRDEKIVIAEMRMYFELYQDLEVAVAKVAKNRGVQLIVRVYEPGPPPVFPDKATNKELGQMQQRVQLYERRMVWFAADEIDLTGDLIKLLEVPLEKDQAPAPAKAEPKPPAKPERGGE